MLETIYNYQILHHLEYHLMMKKDVSLIILLILLVYQMVFELFFLNRPLRP